eukprot:2576749-Pleurochrysis_carterae.AAC.1
MIKSCPLSLSILSSLPRSPLHTATATSRCDPRDARLQQPRPRGPPKREPDGCQGQRRDDGNHEWQVDRAAEAERQRRVRGVRAESRLH